MKWKYPGLEVRLDKWWTTHQGPIGRSDQWKKLMVNCGVVRRNAVFSQGLISAVQSGRAEFFVVEALTWEATIALYWKYCGHASFLLYCSGGIIFVKAFAETCFESPNSNVIWGFPEFWEDKWVQMLFSRKKNILSRCGWRWKTELQHYIFASLFSFPKIL